MKEPSDQNKPSLELLENSLGGPINGPNFQRYSKNTARGFPRMRRLGVVLPPFRIEQSVAAIVGMFMQTFLQKASARVMVDQIKKVNDSLQDIVDYLHELLTGIKPSSYEGLEKYLGPKFEEAVRYFFHDFIEDAPQHIGAGIQFSLDKDEVFKGRIEGIRKWYLNEAIERVIGGQDEMRKRFIKKVATWIEVEGSDLAGLSELLGQIEQEGQKFSRFFARDQFARFNRALTLSSLDEAGFSKVEWVTMGDSRVRSTHKRLNGKTFDIDNLPQESH